MGQLIKKPKQMLHKARRTQRTRAKYRARVADTSRSGVCICGALVAHHFDNDNRFIDCATTLRKFGVYLEIRKALR